MEVDGFTDPVHALAYFQKNPSFFSLVITDILKIEPGMKLMTAFQINSIDLEHNLPIVRYEDILKKPFRLAEIYSPVKKELQIS